jgi:hypothetical protein
MNCIQMIECCLRKSYLPRQFTDVTKYDYVKAGGVPEFYTIRIIELAQK